MYVDSKLRTQHNESFSKEYFSLGGFGGPERTGFWLFWRQTADCLLGAGVLGDSLGSLRHSVLGKLTGQKETDSSLDFSAGDGGSPVVVSQAAGFSSDSLEDVVDKAVHDGHSLGGDSGVRVDLLQHLVDVDGVRLPPPPLALLVSAACSLCLRGSLLCSLGCSFGWHICSV